MCHFPLLCNRQNVPDVYLVIICLVSTAGYFREAKEEFTWYKVAPYVFHDMLGAFKLVLGETESQYKKWY